jgi:RNA polymerase sigma-70 factor (ECF subfamily)
VSGSEQLNILNEWLGKHRALLLKIAKSYTKDPDDQSDLFQEITIQVWHSIKMFRNESAVTTWLYRIALNTAIKWSTKQNKRVVAESLDANTHQKAEVNPEANEKLDKIYREIYRLNGIDKSIFLLLLEGLNYREISEVIGIKESNVGTKISRIKKEMMLKLRNNCYEY